MCLMGRSDDFLTAGPRLDGSLHRFLYPSANPHWSRSPIRAPLPYQFPQCRNREWGHGRGCGHAAGIYDDQAIRVLRFSTGGIENAHERRQFRCPWHIHELSLPTHARRSDRDGGQRVPDIMLTIAISTRSPYFHASRQ